MAFNYSPKIIRNGLVLYLDSTNPKSYPRSGNTWFDLSGYENHGTLNGFTGPSAGSTSGFDTNTSLMMFDRHSGASDASVNNRVIIPNSNSLDGVLCQTGMSVELWVRETSYVCTALIKWSGSWEIYYCSGLVFRVEGTGGTDLSTGVPTSAGSWRNIVVTHSGTVAKVYVNNILISNNNNTISNQNTTNSISIGGYENGVYATNGAIPICMAYNRVLSDNEIAQNYNALKSRFNLS